MKSKYIIYPKGQELLETLGEQIKLARLRRKLSMEMVCERAMISRITLTKIEKGDPSVSLGAYFKVLSIYNLEKDITLLAKDDVFGKKLQDIGLITKKRAPKKQ